MDLLLEDGWLRAEVSALGAELTRLARLDAGVEYLWDGDPTWWARRAPVLFPVVGRLRSDRFVWADRVHPLGQHGFARDRAFAVVSAGPAAAVLELRDDDESRRCFPFPFRLQVGFRLRAGELAVTLAVDNPGPGPLPFSIGLHPGFRWPLVAGEAQDAYRLELEHPETADRWPVEGGLIGRPPVPCLHEQSSLGLSAELFTGGAVVLKDLRSRRVRLVGPAGRGVEVEFPGFPYLGVWSRPGAPFVCIEPWCGLADPVDASGRLEEKEGIVLLQPGERFTRSAILRPF